MQRETKNKSFAFFRHSFFICFFEDWLVIKAPHYDHKPRDVIKHHLLLIFASICMWIRALVFRRLLSWQKITWEDLHHNVHKPLVQLMPRAAPLSTQKSSRLARFLYINVLKKKPLMDGLIRDFEECFPEFFACQSCSSIIQHCSF